MKTFLTMTALVLFYFNVNSQVAPTNAPAEISDSVYLHDYQLIKRYYFDSNYNKAIELADSIFTDSLHEPPTDLYRYLACSYYQTGNLIKAYGQMITYRAKQDAALLDEYDLYLSAQFAARLKNKDRAAMDLLEEAYDKDTCIVNKQLYAAAIVNHYLKKGSTYAATVWREKLLPLKELSRDEMRRISLAWYTYRQEGKATEIFGQFASAYPNAFRSLYMHKGVKMIQNN